jgi:hypothetical protein
MLTYADIGGCIASYIGGSDMACMSFQCATINTILCIRVYSWGVGGFIPPI